MELAPVPVSYEVNKPRRVIGKYFLSKTLGRGSMGKVKLAFNTDTREKVAVKIVTRKLKSSKRNYAEIRTIKEASMMLLLDHPYIAKFYEMDLIDDFYYLFMEYVDGGQLLDYIISHGRLKETQARRIARQIASAIDYCHRNSIVHRDLKVENILISSNGTVKVIDFGLSNVFSPTSQLSTSCGSLYFAAPELLEGKLYVGPEVDVWSFGIVLYVLVCGQVPFDDPTVQGMHTKVKQGVVNYPFYLSSDLVHLLEHMIVVSIDQRAPMTQVIGHPWMNQGYEAPVENFVPKRKPLQLPIDMNVVRGMQGFEFGSEQDIKAELESIISSQEYQQSELQEQRPYERKSFSLAMTDPVSMPAAYHPLISIYYLVQERKQREGTPVREDASSPVVGVAYTVGGKQQVYGASQQKEQEIQRALEVSPRASCELESRKPDEKPTMFERLKLRVSRAHVPAIHIDDQPLVTDLPPVTMKRSVSISVPRNIPFIHGRRRKSTMSAQRDSRMVDGNVLPLPFSANKQGQADDQVKSVYVKGLFSVSTTSSKKASAIRQEILRVLENQKIKHCETNERFECVFHSNDVTAAAVRFDIYIVKIPWLLGMRGVQFRRVDGNTWKYKNACSDILENLRL